MCEKPDAQEAFPLEPSGSRLSGLQRHPRRVSFFRPADSGRVAVDIKTGKIPAAGNTRNTIRSIVNQARSNLRQQLRSLRNGLSAGLRKTNDQAIGRHLLELAGTRRAGRIAGYWPFNGEPDITPSCRQLMAQGWGLALPVIKGDDAHQMDFHVWREDTALGANRYGILEPLDTEPLPVSSFDMLLMPLVGYDRFGHRLGMGAGYYDRCLESIRGLDIPLRVGIAYSLQETEPVDAAEWDIPLHGIVNEHGWFAFDRRQP